MNEQITLTTEQVAENLHCSVKTIRAMRKSGLLSGIKLGCGYLYARAEIDELLAFLDGKSIDSYGDICFLAEEEKTAKHDTGRGGEARRF